MPPMSNFTLAVAVCLPVMKLCFAFIKRCSIQLLVFIRITAYVISKHFSDIAHFYLQSVFDMLPKSRFQLQPHNHPNQVLTSVMSATCLTKACSEKDHHGSGRHNLCVVTVVISKVLLLPPRPSSENTQTVYVHLTKHCK